MTTHQGLASPAAPNIPGIQASKTLTYHFAAAAIAELNFPDESVMPRIDPVPFNNLGHMPLVDYSVLCEILWGCAAEIRATHTRALRASRPLAIVMAAVTWVAFSIAASSIPQLVVLFTLPVVAYYLYTLITSARAAGTMAEFSWGRAIGSILIAYFILTLLDIAVGALGGFRIFGHFQSIVFALTLALVASGIVYLIVRTRCKTKAIRQVKVKYIDMLLADKSPEKLIDHATHAIHPLAKSSVGTGILRPDEVHVFVANGPTDLLPGLGPVGVKELYVCPPKPDDERDQAEACDLIALHRDLEANLAAAAASLPARGLQCSTAHGALAIVDAHSLRSESPWLANHRPFLSVKRTGGLENVVAMRSVDPEAKARVFLGLQVYFPEYSTLVTLAARVFFASSSASVQVLVASLGPPRVHRRTLHERLGWQARQRMYRTMTSSRSRLAAQLDDLVSELATRTDPLAIDPDKHALAALFARAEREKEEDFQAKRLATTTRQWVGPHTRLPNWRQTRSLAMSDQFFEASECVASVRALFAGLVESTLTSLDKQGFNVDAYRDARGKLTIKTESIDQMIIGDRIQINHGERRTTTTDGARAETPASATKAAPTATQPSPA